MSDMDTCYKLPTTRITLLGNVVDGVQFIEDDLPIDEGLRCGNARERHFNSET